MAKKAKRVTKLTIDRRRWKRGGKGLSSLLTESGQMCCLGFLGRECGLEPTLLRRRPALDCIADRGLYLHERIPGMFNADGRPLPIHSALIEANDDGRVTGAQRESRIVELFAEAGIEVTFK